jgi:hypothetical protein
VQPACPLHFSLSPDFLCRFYTVLPWSRQRDHWEISETTQRNCFG